MQQAAPLLKDDSFAFGRLESSEEACSRRHWACERRKQLMQEKLQALIERYGRSVSLSMEDGWHSPQFRALIQPLRYKNKMYLEGVHTPIGIHDPGYYLYIGPAAHDVTKLGSMGEEVWLNASGGERYQIDRAERVYLGEEALYIWAILRSVTEAEQ